MTKTSYQEAGFICHRQMANGLEIGLMKMLFTTDLCFNISTDTAELPYDCRYSYKTEDEALDAFVHWDGNNYPPGNWIKRKSAFLPELSNPAKFDLGAKDD